MTPSYVRTHTCVKTLKVLLIDLKVETSYSVFRSPDSVNQLFSCRQCAQFSFLVVCTEQIVVRATRGITSIRIEASASYRGTCQPWHRKQRKSRGSQQHRGCTNLEMEISRSIQTPFNSSMSPSEGWRNIYHENENNIVHCGYKKYL